MEIRITQSNWNKIQSYCHSAYEQFKSEIGGMAICVERGENEWEIIDPVILKQKVTATNTHLDKEELAKYYTKAHSIHKDTNYRFLWWHTHPNFTAKWSGTDLATIQECKNSDLSFSLVVNMEEEYQLTASIWKPIEIHKDLDLDIEKIALEDVDKEVKKLCEEYKSDIQVYNGYHYNQHQQREMNFWNKSFHTPKDELPDLSSDNEEVITKTYEFLDEAIQRYVSMEIDYNKLKSCVNKWNKLLKKIKSSYLVEIPKRPDDEKFFTDETYTFIGVKSDDNGAAIDLNTWMQATLVDYNYDRIGY